MTSIANVALGRRSPALLLAGVLSGSGSVQGCIAVTVRGPMHRPIFFVGGIDAVMIGMSVVNNMLGLVVRVVWAIPTQELDIAVFGARRNNKNLIILYGYDICPALVYLWTVLFVCLIE